MPERLQREWTSPIYQFFDPVQDIRIVDGRHVHKFKCSAHGCKARIRHYLDTKDSRSTGNMHRHVKSCWGNDVAQAADDAKDVQHMHKHVIEGILRNGSITEAFESKGKGKVTYSHRQHTHAETRYAVHRILLDDSIH